MFHFSWVNTLEWNCFYFIRNCQSSKAIEPFYTPISHVMYNALHPHQHVCIFFVVAILVHVKWFLIVVLICIFLMADDVQHFFICLLAIYFYFLWIICSSLLLICLYNKFIFNTSWLKIPNILKRVQQIPVDCHPSNQCYNFSSSLPSSFLFAREF